MEARDRLVYAALDLIEAEGERGFSTRAACDRASVTAPTLYHHFKDADGLINAAVMLAFEQFLGRKLRRKPVADASADLMAGWDDYVAFARERPRVYAAMTSRVLQGADIPAADAGRANLMSKLAALAAAGRLTLPVASAADLVWSTAHAAALLHVTAAPQAANRAAVSALRKSAAGVIREP